MEEVYSSNDVNFCSGWEIGLGLKAETVSPEFLLSTDPTSVEIGVPVPPKNRASAGVRIHGMEEGLRA